MKDTQALDGSPSPRVEFLRPLTAKKGLPQVGGPGSPYRLVDTFVYYCVHFQTKKCCCCCCCCCGKKHCYQVGARLGGDGVTCGCFCGATIQSEHHLTTCDTSSQPFSWQSFIATLVYSAVVCGSRLCRVRDNRKEEQLLLISVFNSSCMCFRQFGPFERTCIEDFFGTTRRRNRQESDTPHTATLRPSPAPPPDRKPPLLSFQPALRPSSRK